MNIDSRLQRESDNQPYLTKGKEVLEDSLLEGQFAARSVLRNEKTTPVRGVLAFVLPSPTTPACDSLDTGVCDELVKQPDLDFTRLWVWNHQYEPGQSASSKLVEETTKKTSSNAPPQTSPRQILSLPNVRGICLENARPSNVGLELLWFLRSLTNGDVKKICSSLEQTVWTGAASDIPDPASFLDSLASGTIMEVPDVTSYGVRSPPDYTYILDFHHNSCIVFCPDGKRHNIELRSFSPRFLADISRVALSPSESGRGSDICESETSNSDEVPAGYFDVSAP